MDHCSCPQYTPHAESIGLPIAGAAINADVHCLFKPQTFEALYQSPLYYLQEIRRRGKVPNSWHAMEYSRCETEFAMSLSAAIQCYQFDAIVCVPTKRPWLQDPYRQAILRINTDAIDYTSRISTIDPNFVGITLDQRVRNLKLEIEAVPTDLSLLVIDDVLTTGLSAAAVMHCFRLSGARGDSFRLAFPLWIQVGLGSPLKRLLNLVKRCRSKQRDDCGRPGATIAAGSTACRNTSRGSPT